jgi:hypothetical protein
MSFSEYCKENAGFILASLGLISACCAGCLKFILKSRCTEIKCFGCQIKRDVIPPTLINLNERSRN